MTAKLQPILLAACLTALSGLAQTVPEPSPVPQLCELLASSEAQIRLAAAEQLASVSMPEIGLPPHAAVPSLLKVFANDSDARCAEMAALALEAIGTWPLGALDHVAAHLNVWERAGAEKQVVERIHRAIFLQSDQAWPGAAIVPDLEHLLRVPGCEPGVLGALALLGRDAATAAPVVARLLEGDGKAGIRWRAAFALAAMGASGEPLLRKGLADEHGPVRFWSLRALLTTKAPDKTLVGAVLPWLDDDRPLVQQWAIRTVATFGNAAAPAAQKLATLLKPSRTVGGLRAASEAHQALERLGPAAAAAVPALVELLATEDELTNRSAVVEILAAIGPAAAAAIEPLLRTGTMPKSADPNLDQFFENQAQAAIAALARIDPALTVATLLPGVEEKPEDESPATWHRVWRFCALGPGAVSAVPRLRRMLASDDRLAKARALLVLERIGAAAAVALQDIVAVLAIDDDYLRFLALRTIVAIGPAAAPAVPALEALFARAGDRRTDVIRDLHRLGAAAEPLLVRATTDSGNWTRAIAAEQILRFPAASPEALAAVVARLGDADPLVRSEVLQSLVWGLTIGPDQGPEQASLAREQVLRLLTAEDPHVRTTCAEAQWQMLARKVQPDAVARLYWGGFTTLLHYWGLQKRQAAEAGVFRDAASVAAWALPFAADAHAEIRAAAAQVLGQLPSSPASRDALMLLVADADPYLRRAAVAALGWHGPEARVCLPVLAKAFQDSDWFVRAGAASALRAVHLE